MSLLHYVDGYLSQFDGLRSYFLSCNESETSEVQSIMDRLEIPLTKPILSFLSYILPFMDKFKRRFQKSTENYTCQLYSEMNKLVRLYSTNLLKPDVIQAANDNLSNLNLARRDQLSDKSLWVGDADSYSTEKSMTIALLHSCMYIL